eukprot:NODE_95_length_21511_cov_0.501168.p16 type:complete len:166 gc:universal NODE_95_length_21511_cov_0.501168:1298-1795(+)
MFRKLYQSVTSVSALEKGIQHIENNQPKEAIKFLKDAIKKGEKLADSHYSLGLAYYLQKDVKMAVNEWEKSIKIKPQPDALLNLGNIYLLKQDDYNINKAIAYYEQAVKYNPDDGQIHFNLGVAYEKANQLNDALNHYREARDLGIDDAAKHLRNVAAKTLKLSD